MIFTTKNTPEFLWFLKARKTDIGLLILLAEVADRLENKDFLSVI